MISYQYSPLQKTEIRILTLLPGKFEDPLTGFLIHRQFLPASGNVPIYEALSYTWGDQTDMESMAICEGDDQREKLIGPSLATALRHLRQEGYPRDIWCDGLSINQDDSVERAVQVRRMGDIYHEADRVIVWLGPEEDDSSVALEILDRIGSNVRFDPANYEVSPLPGADQRFGDPASALPYEEKDWSTIQKLFARTWFKRLWVRQEIALAKPSAIVVAGHSATTWSRFGQAVGCVEVKIAMGAVKAPFSGRFVSDVANVVSMYRTTLFKHPVALLSFTRSCQCTDSRDRVYSLLGLVEPDYKIQPDYFRSVRDTCKEFMLSIYEEDSRLDILAFCDITASPSWVLNLPGANPANHFWRNFATGYSRAHLRMMQEKKIEVIAIRCGIVSNMIGDIPQGCSDDELKRRVKNIMIRLLGKDTGKWEEETKVKFTQALVGGHWFENTHHRHDPPLTEAVSVLEGWVNEDFSNSDVSPFSDMLVTWSVLYALSGWSVYQTTTGLFGICSNMCLPGDEIYAVLGCKDPITLRKSEDNGCRRIIGPTYISDFSCGQAILEHHALGSGFIEFIDPFDDPSSSPERRDGLEQEGDPNFQAVDSSYQIEDDHPLWHRKKDTIDSAQTDSSRLEALVTRSVRLEKVVLG